MRIQFQIYKFKIDIIPVSVYNKLVGDIIVEHLEAINQKEAVHFRIIN